MIERIVWEYARPEWRLDSRSFFFTRMRKLPTDAPATALQKKKQIFPHVLGTDAGTDKFITGDGAGATIDEADTPIIITLTHTPSPFVILRVKHGDATEKPFIALPSPTSKNRTSGGRKFSTAPIRSGNFSFTKTRST